MPGLLDPVQSAMDYRRDASFSEWAGVMNRVGVAAPSAGKGATGAGQNADSGLGDSRDASPSSDTGGLSPGRSTALGVLGMAVPGPLGMAMGAVNAGMGAVAANQQMDAMAAITGVTPTMADRALGTIDGMTGTSFSSRSEGLGGYGSIGIGGITGMRDMTDPGVMGTPSGVTGRGQESGNPSATQGPDDSADGGGNSGEGDGGNSGEGDGGNSGEGDGGAGGDGWRNGGLVDGPGDGNDDAVKARLSDGEYVLPAKIASAWLPLLEHLRQTGELPDNPAEYRTRSDAQRQRLDAALAQRASTPAARERTRGRGLLS